MSSELTFSGNQLFFEGQEMHWYHSSSLPRGPAHFTRILVAKRSPKEDIAVSVSEDGDIRLWDLSYRRSVNGTNVKSLSEKDLGTIVSLAFDSKGHFVALGFPSAIVIMAIRQWWLTSLQGMAVLYLRPDLKEAITHLQWLPHGLIVYGNDQKEIARLPIV